MPVPDQHPPRPEQFERIVEEYADRVFGIALRITGVASDAEDAMQDAFIAIFRGLGSFRGEAAFSTWIYRIAVNAALQVRRRRPPADRELVDFGFEHEVVADWSQQVEESAERQELAEAIEQGILLLPEDYQVAVILRDVEGLSAAEAADVLHIREAALKSRLHRGRVLLRQYLADYLRDR
jgi:RNA polymerase sigma-70 factor (ECF subfamily)